MVTKVKAPVLQPDGRKLAVPCQRGVRSQVRVFNVGVEPLHETQKKIKGVQSKG